MYKLLTIALLALSTLAVSAGEPVFSPLTYTALDQPQLRGRQYQNPLLPGCYPDPSITRKGSDYYLVNSTFCYYPGVPIWHSTDLVNWRQLGYVLSRRSQLQIDRGSQMSWGVYAPDIKYNPLNDTFYMITTGTGHGSTAYVKSRDPKSGVWSDPVALPSIGGIDPSFCFDEATGRAYIVNNDAPATAPQWDGHRAIWIREFDWRADSVIGPARVIIDGGVDPATKPVWVEGPHLYHINGKYWLMAAEGGTSTNHSEVMFTADAPMGPYTPCPVNPILTQRDLPADRANIVTSTGHADLFQTPQGEWYAVFLGVRPFTADGHDKMGRETFMLPVQWTAGQPVILPAATPLPLSVPLPKGAKAATTPNIPTALWTNKSLATAAEFIRYGDNTLYDIDGDSLLTLHPDTVSLSGRGYPCFIGRWVNSQRFVATTTLQYTPERAGDEAGIALFHDDGHYITFCRTIDAETAAPIVCVEAYSKGRRVHRSVSKIPPSAQDKPLRLEVACRDDSLYTFRYLPVVQPKHKLKYIDYSKRWIELSHRGVPASYISTKTAGGFTGTSIGVYAKAISK